jgi:hypothetical protein
LYEIDHVVLGVPDVQLAAQWLRNQFGLGAVVQGTHADGTAEWVVPLHGGQYLKLLYIVNRERVVRTPDPRDVMRRIDAGGALLSWTLRGQRLDAVAESSGYAPGSREADLANGHVARRRAAVTSSALRGLPDFIEYEGSDEHLRHRASMLAEAGHDLPVGGIAWVELALDAAACRVLDQVAPRLPIRYAGHGSDPITAVGVEVGGEVVRIAVH